MSRLEGTTAVMDQLAVDPPAMLLLSLFIGVVAGLRSATAPAVVAWAAHQNWISLRDSPVSFMGSTVAVAVFTLLAIVELVMDKRPSTPKRTVMIGFLARVVLGALSGAALATTAGSNSGLLGALLGAMLGVIGAIAGMFAGYKIRTFIVAKLEVPDFAIALLEDVVAIGGAILVVSSL